MAKRPENEVLVEFKQVGAYVRATAMDVATLVEVSAIGPLNAQEQLRRTVLAKLDYVLAKQDRRGER